MSKQPDLREIYKGSFKDRVHRFDSGGYVSYPSYVTTSAPGTASYDPTTMTTSGMGSGLNGGSTAGTGLTAQEVAQLTGANSGSATGSVPSGINAPINTPLNASATLLTPSQLGQTSGSSSNAGGGALSAILKALGIGGGNNSTAGLTALAGLLSAAGGYQQNKANMPSFSPPALFGGSGSSGAPALPSSATNGSYGPPGGYNYKNYAGANGSTPGLGFAPRQQTTPNIPNYYTYGQSPQQSFYSTTPQVGTPGVPMAQKKGGSVKRFAFGGRMPQFTPHPGMRPTVGLPPRPMQPPARPIATMGPPLGGAPPMSGVGPRIPNAPTAMATGGSAAVPQANANFVTTNTSPLAQTLAANARKTGQPGIRPYADGGNSRHVKGPGDGTSDSIPARLANGEYVIDAQTVSLAGNGDNGAGAKKFDELRANLRKHKGAALAKGKMPPDASPLHKYMGGQ